MSTAVPGTRFGPYELLSPAGAGGMGEVWKARDTRVDRLVAIKISQKQFSERFEREARATAALNHPNICSLYSLYDVGPDYLVMEFVDGEPIRAGHPGCATARDFARWALALLFSDRAQQPGTHANREMALIVHSRRLLVPGLRKAPPGVRTIAAPP